MNINNIIKTALGLTLVVMAASCSRDAEDTGTVYMPDMMYSQAYETYTSNPALGKDSLSARVPVKGTIPYGFLPADSLANDDNLHQSYLYRSYFPESDTGSYARSGQQLKNPLPNTPEILALGEKVYNINCAVCHGAAGDGQGSIVTSGAYPTVPAYKDRLPGLNDGKMYHTVTYGKGLMGSYAPQVTPRERWAVIYYIQKLAGTGPFGKGAATTTAAANTAAPGTTASK